MQTAPGLSATPVEITPGAAKFDLTISVARRDSGLEGYVEYDAGLFEPSTIARMMVHFETLLAGAAANPDLLVSALPLISADEERQAWIEWNDTARALPERTSLWDVFQGRARRDPSAPAIRSPQGCWSYATLAERASTISRQLFGAGVRRGDGVGVLMDPSASFVAAVLGILAAGGVYVPLDPAHPAQRCLQMVRDARVCIVLTEPGLRVDGVENVEIDDGKWRGDGRAVVRDHTESTPSDVACVLGTYSATEAITRALAGTGFGLVSTGGGRTLTIRRSLIVPATARPAVQPLITPVALRAAPVAAAAAVTPNPEVLARVTVKGAKRPGVVTMRIGEVIPPGLPRREAERRVWEAINALERDPAR